jgi:hypothetical protein
MPLIMIILVNIKYIFYKIIKIVEIGPNNGNDTFNPFYVFL